MHTLSQSKLFNSIQEENQEEYFAKNSLYELAEAEDRLNLQVTHRRSPLLSYKPDSIDQWTNFGEATIKPLNIISKGDSITKNQRQLSRNKKRFFDSEVLPKLQKSVTKNRSNSRCKFFQQPPSSKNSMTLSMNEIFQSKINRISLLRQRKFSQTPNLQIARQFPSKIICKQQDLAWYISRKPLKKQKSLSNNGSKTIKKHKQSIKQNECPPSKTILLKQIHKLRNDWMQLQKMKNLKKKNKLDMFM